jgi:hypothetical protein
MDTPESAASSRSEPVNEGLVAKFYNEDSINKANFERDRWKQLWNDAVFLSSMFETKVLFMPFVFHLRLYKDKLQFCPMYAWNFRLDLLGEGGKFFDQNVIRDDNDISQIKTDYFDKPLLVAEIALKRMIVECGWMQEEYDVRWDHIGLMPIRKTKKWQLKPVMIDLIRLKEVGFQDRRTILSRHLKLLEDCMPKGD